MKRESAGLLMYRRSAETLELLLVHPGGPFFRRKDLGVWTIPKGEVDGEEALLEVARREFQEETGLVPLGPFLELAPIVQQGGKRVHAWAFAGDCDPQTLRSNSVTLEWPPRSGKYQEFPEVDRAAFFDVDTARAKINPAQRHFIDELLRHLELEQERGAYRNEP